MITTNPSIIQFDLPQYLACPKPTEARNLERDEVRLLVTREPGDFKHSTFNLLPSFLQEGDVLVVNTSATVASALPISLPGGRAGKLHVSTRLSDKRWLIEIREVTGNKTVRWKKGVAGMVFQLPSAATVTLNKRYYKDEQWLDLWEADFSTSQPFHDYLVANARPIQYEKLDQQYPLAWYQTFFSFNPGSSEMPSAGRGFTLNLIEKLMRKGVVLAPIILHTGVSSLEENEAPYPEYMEIDPVSASVINTAKRQGRRIIAVGTTCIRAVESAVDREGRVISYRGNTELFIDEDYAMRVIDGLLTGFHEPRASHLNMLQSIGGFEHIESAYREAIKTGYYWHQFGDLHLVLPRKKLT